jgi:primosomal protein N' (replication factor Y)
MSSAGPSAAPSAGPAPAPSDLLTGPVDVVVDNPRLALDRPFTYLATEDLPAGVGSLVSVAFHGRTTRGWVLGPAAEVPEARLLPIRRVRSPVPFFDERRLRLLRWIAERYLAPLATVIDASHPPRVASEESAWDGVRHDAVGRTGGEPATLDRYGGAGPLLASGRVSWLRPLPDEEAAACVAAVRACLDAGRRAIVIVPEADPLPATAVTVLEAIGERAVLFAGGSDRARYRTWLRILGGGADVVVGTRPAVLAPVGDVGLLWISREVHPGHREERTPAYHVREVAMARAELEGAACVLASLAPSVETATGVRAGQIREARAPRSLERAAAPLVETAPPESEDRSVRLAALLRTARSAALVVSRRGYGLARVCRTCGQPAACAICRGPITVAEGRPACRVCGALGTCASCGGHDFGLERGGTERIAEWTARTTRLPVELEVPGQPPPAPGPGRLVVGTAAAVKDLGPVRVDLVGILDPDRALARAGLRAGEQALATWMEAAAWAGPRGGPGRVLLQTRRAGHPAIQALIRWDPVPFLVAEAEARSAAGFAPGHPVFRITGSAAVEPALRALDAGPVLATAGPEGTVCLVAVGPEALPRFRAAVRRLVGEGSVSRVDADPQLDGDP